MLAQPSLAQNAEKGMISKNMEARLQRDGWTTIDISWLVRTIDWILTTGPHQDDAKT